MKAAAAYPYIVSRWSELSTGREVLAHPTLNLRFRPTAPTAIYCESSRLSDYQTAVYTCLFLEALPVKNLRCKGGVTH